MATRGNGVKKSYLPPCKPSSEYGIICGVGASKVQARQQGQTRKGKKKMSAYMVPNENLCKIAGYVSGILNASEHMGVCEGAKAFEMSKDFKKTFRAIPGVYDSKYGEYNAKPIHRALYDMNRDALLARYRKCADAYEPFDGKSVETREETRDEWQCRLFSVIRNYLYQCNEGNVPEAALFCAMRELETKLAYTIAAETAQRDWGCGWSNWKPKTKGERESKMRD